MSLYGGLGGSPAVRPDAPSAHFAPRGCAERVGALEAVAKDVSGINASMLNSVLALEALADQVLGAVPEVAGERPQGESPARSALAAISAHLSDGQQLCNRLARVVERMQTL